MSVCRYCQKPCKTNGIIKDRVFREKLQDIMCMWVDIDTNPSLNLCQECEHIILDFHSFKNQSRNILRNSICFTVGGRGGNKNNQRSAHQQKHDSKTLQALSDNCAKPIDLPIETLDELSSHAKPVITMKVDKTTDEPTTESPNKRRQFRTPEQIHAEKMRPKRKLRRKTAEEKAMSPTEYKHHYYRMIVDKYKITCEVCCKRLPPDRMDGHMNGHLGLQPYTCEYCGLLFNCKVNMRTHISKKHCEDKQIPCILCDKIARCQADLRQHMRMVHEEKKLQCSLCDLKTNNRYDLERHMRIHTQTREYVCHHCGKAFYCNSVLTIHLRTHSGETPYVCPICPKGFVHRRMYVMHMEKLHPKEPILRIDSTKKLKDSLLQKHYS
ncbi:gastrula zinc finger protein xFG20-1-like [Topomyia yanbarensis]|uniref:gastrula zinc finger protein xFG20-1-like n=1 Tax=Topomyia yanbarensis TaxID=2498891 RepID=UPI00273C0D43|nr:gastrula zinc finger protein xFG20-1-like [Topomyia yanbarensis]